MEKTVIEFLDYFAAHALSGYVSNGVSFASREDECREVARACYDLAYAMVLTRQKIIESKNSKETK